MVERGACRRQLVKRGLVSHNVVVRQEEVRVRAIEHHDGHAVVLLDLGEQIM
jgi:ribosomal protein L14